MLLVPRPPEWLASARTAVLKEQEGTVEKTEEVEGELDVLTLDADVVPATELLDTTKTQYRMITVGKKQLLTEELVERKGNRECPVFQATVTTVGDDLGSLEKGPGEKMYETKTKGTRHDAPVRLAGRGAYAIGKQESAPRSLETWMPLWVLHFPSGKR
ncbi:hypothetical protein APHAL10511_007504 [Amanita phalloides]|nr:hypothetical protein APHAL10511_007504 [Amanita phalloides]